MVSEIKETMTENNLLGNFLTFFYGDLFYLTNKKTGRKLYVDINRKSPATQNLEGIINIKIIFHV